MKKKHLEILERIFAAELADRLPFQSKLKAMGELESLGLIEPMERLFGVGPFGAVVKGWSLTHAGRMAYCATCK